jgi:hypothetical protein
MITHAQCEAYIAECRVLGVSPNISIQRATAVMAACEALSALAHHVAHYEAIVKEEARNTRGR